MALLSQAEPPVSSVDSDTELRRHKQLDDDDYCCSSHHVTKAHSNQPSLLSRTLHTLLTATVCFILGLLAGPTFHQLGLMTGVEDWYTGHSMRPDTVQHPVVNILPVPTACPVYPSSPLLTAAALQSNASSALAFPSLSLLNADRSWQTCRVQPGVIRASSALSSSRPLIQRQDGMPLVDVFAQMDEAFIALGRWPGTVDLLVRTHWRAMANMHTLFDSIELFWPKNLGRCIVVMDAGSQRDFYINVQLPAWCEVAFEEVNEDNKRIGYWLQQYSNFWSDNYTTADYVAIFDSDSALNSPVTPDMLFDDEQRVLLFADPNFEKGRWDKPNSKLLGNPHDEKHPNHTLTRDSKWRYPVNLMNNLPLLFPRSLFPSFREFCLHVHASEKFANFEALNKWGLRDGLDKGSQMSALNNYWAFLAPDALRSMVHVLWQDDVKTLPRMRIGAHLPLSQIHSQNMIYQPKDCNYKDTKEANVLASTSTANLAQAICLFTPPQHATFSLHQSDKQASLTSSDYSVSAVYDPSTSPNSTVNPYSVAGCTHHWPHASFEKEPSMSESLTTLPHYQYSWYYVDLQGGYTVHDWWTNIKQRPALSVELYMSRARWMQQITQRIRPRNATDTTALEARRQQAQWNELIDFLRQYPNPQTYLPVEIRV